jgi:hypothetical protein
MSNYTEEIDELERLVMSGECADNHVIDSIRKVAQQAANKKDRAALSRIYTLCVRQEPDFLLVHILMAATRDGYIPTKANFLKIMEMLGPY